MRGNLTLRDRMKVVERICSKKIVRVILKKSMSNYKPFIYRFLR